MTDTTILRLEGMGVPPYSARGLTQSLEPIQGAGQVRRTVNGTLVDFSGSQFRKYKSTISCNDQQAPALEGIWPGMTLTVYCVAELGYETSTGGPSRPVASSRTDGDYTFYAPILEMKVMNFSETRDEYGSQVQWTLELEEV